MEATEPNCIFCQIVGHNAPASRIFEDDTVVAFMGIRPSRHGECLVIPKRHIDHFTDVDDATSQRIIVIAQHIGRRMRDVFKPKRVGMVVHGFGVPHAHLILLPQWEPDDITSARFARREGNQLFFSNKHLPLVERSVLDEHAALLRITE